MTCLIPVICGLKIRRETLGWSLDKLGRRCGIDESFLSDWEYGLGVPRLDELQDWAAALGLAFELVPAESKPRRGLQIDWDKRCIKVDGTAVRLTNMEWKVLERLAQTPDELVTHRALFRHLYGDERRYQAQSTAIRVLMTKLRRLLPVRIEAQWGYGYVISGLPSWPAHAPNSNAMGKADATPPSGAEYTLSERVLPMSKTPPQSSPPIRLQPVDRGTAGLRRSVGVRIPIGPRRAEELGVIERFLAERGVTRCPDVATIQDSPLPALMWDKVKRKWVRPSVTAKQAS